MPKHAPISVFQLRERRSSIRVLIEYRSPLKPLPRSRFRSPGFGVWVGIGRIRYCMAGCQRSATGSWCRPPNEHLSPLVPDLPVHLPKAHKQQSQVGRIHDPIAVDVPLRGCASGGCARRAGTYSDYAASAFARKRFSMRPVGCATSKGRSARSPPAAESGRSCSRTRRR